MKRKTQLNIGGKEYSLCYTLRSLKNISEEYESPDKLIQKIDSKSAVESIEAQIFCLHELILAGAKLNKMNGEESPILSMAEVRTLLPLTHIVKIKPLILQTLAVCSSVSIEALPPKKITRKVDMPTYEHYLWQGLHLGLDYNTCMDIPFGELLTLISEETIQNGAKEKPKKLKNSNEDIIPDWD